MRLVDAAHRRDFVNGRGFVEEAVVLLNKSQVDAELTGALTTTTIELFESRDVERWWWVRGVVWVWVGKMKSEKLCRI